jgi:hypothetical protein
MSPLRMTTLEFGGVSALVLHRPDPTNPPPQHGKRNCYSQIKADRQENNHCGTFYTLCPMFHKELILRSFAWKGAPFFDRTPPAARGVGPRGQSGGQNVPLPINPLEIPNGPLLRLRLE